MHRIFKIFVVTSLLLTTLVSTSSSQGANDASNREEAASFVRSYFEFLVQKDISSMKERWDQKSTNYKGYFEAREKAMADIEMIELQKLEVRRAVQDQDRLSVDVRAEFKSVDVKTKNPARVFDTDNRFFELVRSNGIWTIVRHESLESFVADRLAVAPDRASREAILKEYDGLLPIGITRALISRGQGTLFQPGGAFASVDMFERAFETAEYYGDQSHYRSILPNLGTAYQMTGDFQRSTEYFQRSLELFRKLNDADFESRVWLMLGTTYALFREYPKSIEAIEKRLQYTELAGNKRDMIVALINLAASHAGAGNFQKALELQTRNLDLHREIGASDPSVLKTPQMAALLQNIGLLYGDLGVSDKATEFNNLALELNEQVGNSNPGLMFNIGEQHLRHGELLKAEELLDRAYKGFQVRKYRAGMEVTLNALGDVYLARGDLQKSLEYKLRALNESLETGQRHRIDTSNLLVAYVHLRLGNNAAALEISTAIADRKPEPGSEGVYREANYLTGRILNATGEVENAKKYLQRSIAVAESQRKGSELNLKPYHELVRLQLKEGKKDAAFETAQSTKSRLLLDMFVRGRQEISKSMSAEELLTNARLKSELVSLPAKIAAEKTRKPVVPGRIEQLETEQLRKRLELDSFEKQLYVRHPELKVFRGDLNAVTVADIPSLVDDRLSAVVDFIVGEDFTVVFVAFLDDAGKPTVASHILNLAKADLEKKVREFTTNLANGDLNFQAASRELFGSLLRSVEKDLVGKTNIIIVPDGPLWDLPFQALMDGNGKYLVEKAAISYAPSLTALREMSKKAKSRKAAADAELIAFGNPIVEKATKERVQRVFMNEKLEPLPEAERLVNGLGKMYGPKRSKILIGNAAREEVAKSEVPKYRIVQFATHGILNNVSPMYSHLVMAQDAKNPNEDGLLEAWELKDLNLNADMVILSACDTARGKISGGEGIIGMTWASFIAGAPTTVASQWKVESSSTTEFMLEFHRQLLANKKISKAEAMRRAALKLMRMPKYKHPSYWGAWVLVGDGS